MGRYISQETFDNVVWENINEFEMSPLEALDDAINQFQAQGVDLCKISKDVKFYERTDNLTVKQQIQVIIDGLKNVTQDSILDNTTLKETLANFKKLCNNGIAEKCMATELGACKILVQLISTATDNVNKQENCMELLDELLGTFSVYINQQPDVVDEDDIKVYISIFNDTCQQIGSSISKSDKLINLLARCTLLTDIFTKMMYIHEKNKCFLMLQHVHSISLQLVSQFHNLDITASYMDEACRLIKNICKMLCAFVRDDDVRVVFGQSYQHALNIVECQAVQILMNLIHVCNNDVKASSEILACLSTLCVCEDVCLQVSDANGVKIVFGALANCLHTAKKVQLVKSGLQFLKCLCGSDKMKHKVMNHEEGTQIIVELMEENISNSGVSEVACALIACLVLRHAEHGHKLVLDFNIHQILCRMMVKHSQVSAVQRVCGMAIRNIVSRNEDLIECFLECDAEKLLRDALEIHGDKCRDEVTYALRDLHCNVQLRELWTGTGKNLNR